MWIEINEREQYNDCNTTGLRLKFYGGITESERRECKLFCDWLRKKFWFPIRVYLLFVHTKKFKDPDDGHLYYGIFYSNDESKRKVYPRICIAAEFDSEEEKEETFLSVAHELTHYYQWYFLEDEKKSGRSLEIMANKWARYVVGTYLDEKGG